MSTNQHILKASSVNLKLICWQ